MSMNTTMYAILCSMCVFGCLMEWYNARVAFFCYNEKNIMEMDSRYAHNSLQHEYCSHFSHSL